MPFETLSERMQFVANRSLAYFRDRYGSTGLKIDTSIADTISWRPSFHMRASRYHIIAVEVADNLYPAALRGAAHEISLYQSPVSVYQVCSLEAYTSDTRQREINALKQHGFGIATVDDSGGVMMQHLCIPMAQFISRAQFEVAVSGLTAVVKNPLKSAYETYVVKSNQGLQEAAQIVEGIISSIALQAAKKGVLTNSQKSKPLSEQIDDLYVTNEFKSHRAALGGARDFIKQYRNSTSHSPTSARQAFERARSARNGFIDSINVCSNLSVMARKMGYKLIVHSN